jgi:hypothetical protein
MHAQFREVTQCILGTSRLSTHIDRFPLDFSVGLLLGETQECMDQSGGWVAATPYGYAIFADRNGPRPGQRLPCRFSRRR